MVFNATFSYIVAVSFIGGGNGNSQRTGLILTILVVIGTDCTGSYKSNYYTITTMTALLITCIGVFCYFKKS